MLARPLIDTASRRQLQEVGHDPLQHVLLVEDDPATRRVVAQYFATHDVLTTAVTTRTELERYLASHKPALIILSQRLGKDNGLDLLRLIRACSDVPVIIAGRHRAEEIDCVVGLELGADDYIAKPFQLRELLARVRAIVRRQMIGQTSRVQGPRHRSYTFDGWCLELATRRLTNPDGQPVPLTRSEYALLLAFLEAPQRPLQRGQLLHSSGAHEDIFDRSVDVQILRLRRKLKDDLAAPGMILTERGVGYSFAPQVRSL